jgi:hypothetical protein
MEVVLELEDDALAESTHSEDPLPNGTLQRGRDAAQEKGAFEVDLEQPLSLHPLLEGFHIDCNIGEFGHVRANS